MGIKVDPENTSCLFLTLISVSTAASICFLQLAIPNKGTLKASVSHKPISTSLQVTELKERLRPMRGFWVSLPHTICNDEKAAADITNEDRCWNGQTRGRWARSERWGGGTGWVEERGATDGAEVEGCNRWKCVYLILPQPFTRMLVVIVVRLSIFFFTVGCLYSSVYTLVINKPAHCSTCCFIGSLAALIQDMIVQLTCRNTADCRADPLREAVLWLIHVATPRSVISDHQVVEMPCVVLCCFEKICYCVAPCLPCLCHQVPPRCDWRWAGEPDQQPRGGSGHRQTWCEDQAANHGAQGGDQQVETCSEWTGHGLHGQWVFLIVVVYATDRTNWLESTNFLKSNLTFVPGEEGSGSGGGDHSERYNDDWPGYGSNSPPYSKPARNPAANPAKPPRVRNGHKWNRNSGHGRPRSASVHLTFSLLPLLCLPFIVTVAPMWR